MEIILDIRKELILLIGIITAIISYLISFLSYFFEFYYYPELTYLAIFLLNIVIIYYIILKIKSKFVHRTTLNELIKISLFYVFIGNLLINLIIIASLGPYFPFYHSDSFPIGIISNIILTCINYASIIIIIILFIQNKEASPKYFEHENY